MKTKTVERSILRRVNAERRKRGLPELKSDRALIRTARKHSKWMARKVMLDHYNGRNGPDGRAEVEGYVGGVGENIWATAIRKGRGTTWKSRFRWSNERELGKAAVISWMNSSGHRRNMLSSRWEHIGIGMAVDKGGHNVYLTQNFGYGFSLSKAELKAAANPIRLRPPRFVRRGLRRLCRQARNLDREFTGKPHRWPRLLTRPVRKLWRRLRRRWREVARRLAVGILVVYAGLTVFHLAQGFGFTSALGGGIQDLRVVGVCFGEWGEMKEFIARDAFMGKDLGKLALDLSGGECGAW